MSTISKRQKLRMAKEEMSKRQKRHEQLLGHIATNMLDSNDRSSCNGSCKNNLGIPMLGLKMDAKWELMQKLEGNFNEYRLYSITTIPLETKSSTQLTVAGCESCSKWQGIVDVVRHPKLVCTFVIHKKFIVKFKLPSAELSSPQLIVRHSISNKLPNREDSAFTSASTFTLQELVNGIKLKTLPPQIFSFVSVKGSGNSNSSGASNLCAMRAHNMHSDYLGKIISLVPPYATNRLSSNGKWCLCGKLYKTSVTSAVQFSFSLTYLGNGDLVPELIFFIFPISFHLSWKKSTRSTLLVTNIARARKGKPLKITDAIDNDDDIDVDVDQYTVLSIGEREKLVIGNDGTIASGKTDFGCTLNKDLRNLVQNYVGSLAPLSNLLSEMTTTPLPRPISYFKYLPPNTKADRIKLC